MKLKRQDRQQKKAICCQLMMMLYTAVGVSAPTLTQNLQSYPSLHSWTLCSALNV